MTYQTENLPFWAFSYIVRTDIDMVEVYWLMLQSLLL